MLQKIFVACVALICSLHTFSQTASVENIVTDAEPKEEEAKEEKKLSITGSADAYYRYDFAKTKANNLTSFTNSQNTFALGMASVKFEHKSDKIGAVLDLGFGTRASEFTYNDAGLLAPVKQLYLTFSPADWITFTAGSWATHVGYELLDPQLNRNYSMSYMFTNGPFSHTGVKAAVTRGKHNFMVGVANATDYRTVPEDMINKKFLLAQYSVAPGDNVGIYVNYAGGQFPDTSKANQFDVVVTAKVSDKFSIGYNGTVSSVSLWDGTKNTDRQSWWGSALYLNADPVSWFGLTLRGEYFSDKNQLKVFSSAIDGGSLFATTLSANFKSGSFTLIPEFRVENASESIFIDKNGAAKKSYGSFLLAAIYSF